MKPGRLHGLAFRGPRHSPLQVVGDDCVDLRYKEQLSKTRIVYYIGGLITTNKGSSIGAYLVLIVCCSTVFDESRQRQIVLYVKPTPPTPVSSLSHTDGPDL